MWKEYHISKHRHNRQSWGVPLKGVLFLKQKQQARHGKSVSAAVEQRNHGAEATCSLRQCTAPFGGQTQSQQHSQYSSISI